MNFTDNTHSTLPQFSEISKLLGSDPLLSDIVLATADTSSKQVLLNTQNKYQNAIFNFADASAYLQLSEKPNLQTLTIPSYNQNNSVVNVQSQILPVKFVQNIYAQQDNNDDKNDGKNDENLVKNDNENLNEDVSLQQIMIEYLKTMQSTTIPLSFQHFVRLHQTSEQLKKENEEEQKNDQTQNNILNIPNVQIYKTTSQLINENQIMNENTILINPMNMHLKNQTENPTEVQTSTQHKKSLQKTNNNSPKPQKKAQFRPKLGEVKISFAFDGSPLYQCPECMNTFSNKLDIDEHMKKHFEERKFKCLDCGAMLKRREHLDQHVRGHSDERPFVCKLCSKAFKRNEHLTRHHVTHSGHKNFSCSICNKAFSRKDHLTKHTQTHSGTKKQKIKKVSSLINNTVDVTINAIANPTSQQMILRPDLNSILKDEGMKQENKAQQLIQHIQNLPDSKMMFSLIQEQFFKDNVHHEAVNMNDILPQSTRYLPSA